MDVKIALVVTVRNAQGVESKKNIYSDKVPLSSGGYTTLNSTVTIDTKSLESTALTPVNFSIAIATFVKDTSTKTNVTAGWYAVNNLEVRRASAGEITAGLLKSKDGETYINLDTGDAQLTGTVRVKGANYDVWLKSETADGETEAGLYLTKTDGSDTNGRVVLYEDSSGDTCVAIAGETIVIGASSSDSNYANNLLLQSTGYLSIQATNNIAIQSLGFTSNKIAKGGKVTISCPNGFNVTCEGETTFNTGKINYNKTGALWEINPAIKTESLKVTSGVYIKEIEIGSYPELWTSSGSFMGGDQRASLAKNVSAMPNGIVLVWSAYSTKAEDYCWNYTFVPKEHVAKRNGGGVSAFLTGSATFNYVALKYIYVYDNEVLGISLNTTDATIGGIQSTPKKFVLRKIIGI